MALTEVDTFIVKFLRERTRLLEAVVDNFPGGIALFDADLRLVVCNDRLKLLLDYPEMLFKNGTPSLETIFRFNAERGEYGPGNVEDMVQLRMELARKKVPHCYERTRPNGTMLEVRGIPLAEGGFVTTYLDVTAQRQSQAHIAHLAYHDPLTGLANRSLMLDRLGGLLARARRGEAAAVHYLDLDRFKAVNDKHGHSAGDCLLKSVADRLRQETRDTDTVARIGGDEFIILQTAIATPTAAEIVAERVVDALHRPFDVFGMKVQIGVSIGIAITPDDGVDPDIILNRADEALYRCKCSKHDRFAFFCASATKPVRDSVDAIAAGLVV